MQARFFFVGGKLVLLLEQGQKRTLVASLHASGSKHPWRFEPRLL
jgi:hypothetical protein